MTTWDGSIRNLKTDILEMNKCEKGELHIIFRSRKNIVVDIPETNTTL